MSLDGFQAILARLVADPELVLAVRADDANLAEDGYLTPFERTRLLVMVADERIEVLCSLYRSNRLKALVRTVPEVISALGTDLAQTLQGILARDAPDRPPVPVRGQRVLSVRRDERKWQGTAARADLSGVLRSEGTNTSAPSTS